MSGLTTQTALHRNAVFLGNLGHFDLGADDDLQAGFVVSGLQHFRRQVVDSLFKEDAFAVELFDGSCGGALPFRKPGDLELFGSLFKDLIAGGGKILCGNRNDQFVFAVFRWGFSILTLETFLPIKFPAGQPQAAPQTTIYSIRNGHYTINGEKKTSGLALNFVFPAI